jgi:hypothetical protein
MLDYAETFKQNGSPEENFSSDDEDYSHSLTCTRTSINQEDGGFSPNFYGIDLPPVVTNFALQVTLRSRAHTLVRLQPCVDSLNSTQ